MAATVLTLRRMDPKELARRLRICRASAGLTQANFSKAGYAFGLSNFHRGHVSRLEKGEETPRSGELAFYAREGKVDDRFLRDETFDPLSPAGIERLVIRLTHDQPVEAETHAPLDASQQKGARKRA